MLTIYRVLVLVVRKSKKATLVQKKTIVLRKKRVGTSANKLRILQPIFNLGQLVVLLWLHDLGSFALVSFMLKSTWQVPETQALAGKDILANHLRCKVEALRQK